MSKEQKCKKCGWSNITSYGLAETVCPNCGADYENENEDEEETDE